ncbi:MAG TPA: hypothetical protein VMU16_09260 [Candidatus Binataceae bacterium]|nr:hypothetical protein [Candidatus Binataceae bacterium]
MAFRHTAALALAGWYLMAPPFNRASMKVELEARFSKWENLRSYDPSRKWEGAFASREDCEGFRTNGVNWYQRQTVAFQNDLANMSVFAQMRDAICVSNDDPRLMEK